MEKRTKPTSYQAAKLLVSVNEEITAKAIIDRMMTQGRKEVPTNRSLAAKLRKIKTSWWFARIVHKVPPYSSVLDSY